MPIAVVAFDFDPLLRLGDSLVVRWQTVALAAVILVGLAVAGVVARRAGLRPDDLLYLAIGAVPGAVIGGRLGDLVVRPEPYGAGPLSLLDPAVGGLELGLGVVGGSVAAALVGSLLGAPVGRWANLLAVPLLLALGAGKLTMALGGSGQGLPLDAAWATAYLGPGPWGSLAPDLPSHPAQVYEGLTTLALGLGLLAAQAVGRLQAPDGRLLLVAVGGWAAIRAVVSVTWRDPAVVAFLPAGGVLAVSIAAGGLVALVGPRTWPSRRAATGVPATGDSAWPDAEAPPPS